MSENIIQIKNLIKHFYFDKKKLIAVNDVSFNIKIASTLALVGESGCGKSTIAKMILQLIKPTSGDIYFENENILNIKDQKNLKKQIQIIFQDHFASLNPRMTVQDILSEPLKIHKIGNKKQIKEIVDNLLNEVNLSPNMKSRFPHEFSGGQRQRIGIARALALNPKFIVCDEPISALDVSIQAQIINLLNDLQIKHNFTYLLIAHDLAVVKHTSDEVCVMYLGEILEMGKTKEIFSNPMHPYTQALIAAVPVPNPLIEKNKKRSHLKKDLISSNTNGCIFYPRCPKAKEICKNTKPKLKNTHSQCVKCHLV